MRHLVPESADSQKSPVCQLCQPFPCCVCIFHPFLELPCSWMLCPISKIPVAAAGRISPAGKPHSSAACFPLVYAKKRIWFYFYFLFFLQLCSAEGDEKERGKTNKIYRDTDPVEPKDKQNLISHTNSWTVIKKKKRNKQLSWDFMDTGANPRVLELVEACRLVTVCAGK